MMRVIKLVAKRVSVRPSPLQAEQELELKSINFITCALEQNIENTKGIDRMIRIAGILDKVKKQSEKGNILSLDDSDYLVLKDSVDKIQWGFAILHFPEFLDSIANPEKIEKVAEAS